MCTLKETLMTFFLSCLCVHTLINRQTKTGHSQCLYNTRMELAYQFTLAVDKYVQ